MMKTKSQLRAEAVERLRKLNCMDVDCYQLLEATVDDAGEKVGYRVEIRKLIDLLTDEPMDARRDSDGTCPIDDGTVSNHSKNAPTLSDLYGILGGENVPETLDFAENPQKTEFKERESAPSDELPEGDAVAILRKAASYDGDYSGPSEALRRLTDSTTVYFALETLADMVERDYVSRQDFAAQHRTLCGVRGQRDEAREQVDAMRDVIRDFRDERDGWKAKAEQAQERRDDLGSQPKNLGSEPSTLEDFEGKGSEVDSREELEADALALVDNLRMYGCKYAGDAEVEIIGVLDRQAAITERECREYEDALREQHHKRIAELEAERDRYREKLDYDVRDWKGEAKTQRNNFEQATEARKHWQRKYETVKAERDELKSKADALEADKASWQSGYHIDRLAKLQAQRDRYRDLLSKAVDEAQAIVKLMEVDS